MLGETFSPPTLLLWGEYDMLIDQAAREYTRAAMPDAQVAQIYIA
jgi:pimeloyl-ACP methyl ester carboxylesterase